jgi:hypothetical protein
MSAIEVSSLIFNIVSAVVIPFCGLAINMQNKSNNKYLRLHEITMALQDITVEADKIWKIVTINGYNYAKIWENYKKLVLEENGHPVDETILIAKSRINKFLEDVVRHYKGTESAWEMCCYSADMKFLTKDDIMPLKTQLIYLIQVVEPLNYWWCTINKKERDCENIQLEKILDMNENSHISLEFYRIFSENHIDVSRQKYI